METTTSATNGNRPGRKAKDARAAQHELPSFPASCARRQIQVAASLVRHHITQSGTSVLLLDALGWLDRADAYILEWRTADMQRTEYAYQHKTGHA